MTLKSSLVPLLVCALVTACAPSTKLTAVWKTNEPARARFRQVLVVAQTKDRTQRRAAEMAITRRIKNSKASYEVFTDEEITDPVKAKAKVSSLGFDGAVVVRFVGADTKTTYVPGTTYWGPAPYGSMWGYWGYGWSAAYDPGYLATDTVVTLDSNVYSVSLGELIWASRSDTINPGSITALMDSVIDATVREMKKQKIL